MIYRIYTLFLSKRILLNYLKVKTDQKEFQIPRIKQKMAGTVIILISQSGDSLEINTQEIVLNITPITKNMHPFFSNSLSLLI